MNRFSSTATPYFDGIDESSPGEELWFKQLTVTSSYGSRTQSLGLNRLQ